MIILSFLILFLSCIYLFVFTDEPKNDEAVFSRLLIYGVVFLSLLNITFTLGDKSSFSDAINQCQEGSNTCVDYVKYYESSSLEYKVLVTLYKNKTGVAPYQNFTYDLKKGDNQ